MPLDLSLADGRATVRGVLNARWLRRMSVGHDQSSDGSVASFASARPSSPEPTPSPPGNGLGLELGLALTP